MIKIKDIAERAGVSPTTVSNVIHGNTKKVSTSTIEKIESLIKETNYVPSMAARMLVNNSSNIIGVIIAFAKTSVKDTIQDPFFSQVIAALEEQIRMNGYYMMLYAVDNISEALNLVSTWRVDGLIVLSINEEQCDALKKTKDVPFVTIDCHFKKKYYNVGLDDYNGGYIMTQYLIDNGHRDIIFLADNRFGLDGDRWSGFKQAMLDNGINCGEERYTQLKVRSRERIEQYNEIKNELLSHSALFYSADRFAVEAINYFADNNVKVPEQISVVGFDDNSFAQIVRPRLTTVRQDVTKKAEKAMEKLIDLIQGNEIEEYNTKLPVELIIRDSVKKIN